MYYCELEPRDSIDDDAEEVTSDEVKMQNQDFSSPPPNCYLNPSFFASKVEDKSKFSVSSSKRSRDTYTPVSVIFLFEEHTVYSA